MVAGATMEHPHFLLMSATLGATEFFEREMTRADGATFFRARDANSRPFLESMLRAGNQHAAEWCLAFDNLLTVLATAGARPEHLVRVRIYVRSADDYAAKAGEIGKAWRARFGRWFPAMTLVEIARLYDPGALIEVEAEAVIPDA